MKFILRMLVSAAAIFGVAYLSNQALLTVDEFWPSAVIAAVVLAVVNAVVRPIAKALALPITLLTLGLFSLVINAGMLYLVAALVSGVHTTGFFNTVLAALIISIVNAVASSLIDKE